MACADQLPLSGTKQGLQSREPRARFRESLPPALLQLGSRSVGEERGLEGSAGTIATCTELCLASCPRDNRTVPLQLAPDVARCNPLAPSRLQHSDGLYQFPAQTSSSRGRSRMLTRSKGRNHNLNARSVV